MKTINFITSHFLPENTACTNRVLSMVKELEKSYKINIICLTEKGVMYDQQKIKFTDNIDVYYIFQDLYNGKNFFNRAFQEIMYVSKLVNVAKKIKCDITIATTPYMFIIPIIGFRVGGYKVLDIRDLVWEYLNDSSILNNFIKKILRRIMKNSMAKFDEIIVTNEYELDFLSRRYGFFNAHIIPNGIEEARYNKLVKIEPSVDSKFTITYVGNIGLAQNVKVFIDAALELKDIEFLIIGDGIDKINLEQYANSVNASNVVFTGKLEWNALEEYYAKSSILYAQLDEKYVSAMPSKLYEYASIGLPIIYGGVGEAKNFIAKLENSIAIQPNNISQLIQAIEKIRNRKLDVSIKNRELIASKYLREKTTTKINKIIGV